MKSPSPEHPTTTFGPGLVLLSTHKSRDPLAGSRVSLRARGWWCWNNLCRLVLIKVWFQMAMVLCAMGWWLWNRNNASTVATVAIILVLSSWMMSRERIRRSLAGEHTSSRLCGRVDDDWSTFGRPFLCLDEINNKRKAQERKDRTACRIGIVCTLLAGIVAVVGFRN